MTVQLRRPILVAGLGVLGAVWVGEHVLHTLADWFPALVVGAGVAWMVNRWWQQGPPNNSPAENRPIDFSTVKAALVEAEQAVGQLTQEATNPASPATDVLPQVTELRTQLGQATQGLSREDLRLIVLGGQAVGKTTLMRLLQETWANGQERPLLLQDSPGLFAGAAAGVSNDAQTRKLSQTADLVIFVTAGDLTDPELQVIRLLTQRPQRVLLVLNKQDQYLPDDRQLLLTQLRQRVQGILSEQDVVAVAANPGPMKVRQHQPDGSLKEWLEPAQPDVTSLTQRLTQILSQEGQRLVLTSSLSQARSLKQEATQTLNDIRRRRALPVIEQYQWITATTAFASPFPALDVLATAAINGQMVLELSNLYQQKFSLQQAKEIAGTLAGLMVKLGLVEISTRAIAHLLKTNAVTYVAGGLIQGISAAYLTRLAGLSLIEYFQSQGQPGEAPKALNLERLRQIVQSVFQQNQRQAFLQTFVQQGWERLLPKGNPAMLPASQVEPLAAIVAEPAPVELETPIS